MRYHKDTQIFREWDDAKEQNYATDDEWKLIKSFLTDEDDYTFCRDDANGFYAIAFHQHNQADEEYTLWGGNIVDALNELGQGNWFLGDPDEEYVWVM